MQFLNHQNPLLVIVGPTAVGKTEIAISVAQKLQAEIISADSRLFYHGMDIGTAKPSVAERGGIPHHLMDVSTPDKNWSLVVFQSEVKKVIQDVYQRNKLPIIVGGTGQYIQAVIDEWEVPQQEPDLQMREALENLGKTIGPFELHHKLSLMDPEAAEVIQAQNMRRTIRALEVIFLTGKKFSEQRRRKESPYSVLMIGLDRPRPELYTRVDGRIEAMFQDGFVDEVKGLLEAGYSPDLPTFSAIGYREVIEYLHGNMSLEEVVIQMKRLTRQYVRRQANWFKKTDPRIHWFKMCDTTSDEIINFIYSGAGWVTPEEKEL